jgi:outer membrane receptor protein involved in Fe transport
MTKRFNLFRTVAAATVITGLAPGLAAAQDAPAPTAAEDDDTIVVTARKREEALQDVPISVTAFTASTIEDRNILNTTDLAAFTPGFAFNEGFGRDGDRPVIRGTSNILVAEGKVGIFIDGAPIVGDTSAIDLESFQRVEVIKGPQSAVFGRGTLSGAINYVSRVPGEEYQYKVEGTLGNWGRADFYGSVSGPVPFLGDVLRGAVSYKSYNFDGDYNNALAPGGERLGSQKSETWNTALFFTPMDDLRVNVRYIHAEDNDGHYAIRLQPSSANNCFLTTRPTFCGEFQLPDRFEINTADILRPGLSRETDRVLWTANWDIADTGLTINYQGTVADQSEVSGYDQSYDSRRFDIFPTPALCVTGSPANPANRDCSKTNFNDTSGYNETVRTHEVRVEWDNDLPIRGRVGYFTLDRIRKNDFTWLELTAAGPDTAGERSETLNSAFFGGLEWDIVENLKLGLEVRQQQDKISANTLAYRVGDRFPTLGANVLSPNANNFLIGNSQFTAANFVLPANQALLGGRALKFEATLPRVTLDYRVNDDVLLYGQYAKGNAPGGFNASSAPDPYKTFDEEELTNYELGVKTQVLGFDYLNLTGFFMKYDNQILTTNCATATTQVSCNINIGEQDIKGVEFEAQREFFEGFKLTGTLSFVDGEFTAGEDPQQALFAAGAYCSTGTNPGGTGTTAQIRLNATTPLTTGALPNGTVVTTPLGGVPANTSCVTLASIVGKQSPLVPPLQASLGARYEREVRDGLEFFIGADLIYRDSFYGQVDNLNETGSSTKVNAQFGFEGDHIKATVWGKNLTNDDTVEGILRYVDFLGARPPGLTGTGLTGAPGFQGTPRAFALAAPRKPAVGITVSYNW